MVFGQAISWAEIDTNIPDIEALANYIAESFVKRKYYLMRLLDPPKKSILICF